ncbi:MAG TPA: alpha/beta hydrolase [Actinomycetota bacterium]|nr:alpha/beta hydrolase [Actinomycetota bacterium]
MGARVGAVVGVLALGVVLAVVVLWSLQRRLIYYPHPARVPAAASVLPGSEEVAFDTEDGLRLRGWFVPGRGGGGAAVLVCNGNGGNRSLRAPLAAALSRAGLSVLLFDYRGYGGNPGHPSEAGLAADARAARAWLAARDGVDPDRIVYLGESLGAAVALGLAVERPPAALVLRSPFTSLADVGRLHYPWLPVGLLLADRYPSLDRVGRLTVPLLVVAGEGDRVVPAAQSRRLYEAAPEPKRFALVPGADHNDWELLAGARLLDEVLGFLDGTAGLRLGRGPSGP